MLPPKKNISNTTATKATNASSTAKTMNGHKYDVNNIKDFYTNMVSANWYKDRLKTNGYGLEDAEDYMSTSKVLVKRAMANDADEVSRVNLLAKNRLDSINRTQIKTSSKSSTSYTNDGTDRVINLQKEQLNNLNAHPRSATVHEYGHSETDGWNGTSISGHEKYLYDQASKGRTPKTDDGSYVSGADGADEAKSDINTIRYNLHKTNKFNPKSGEYDTKDKKFNKGLIPLIKNDYNTKRMLDAYGEDGLVDLMNTIANNKKQSDMKPQYMAMGGKMRPSSRKRAIVPVVGAALLSGGVSMLSSALGIGAAAKAKKEAELQRRKGELAGLNNQFMEQKMGDDIKYNDSNIYGEDNVEYYADGGNIEQGSEMASDLTPEQMAILQRSMAQSNQVSPDAPVSQSGYQTKGGVLKPIGDGMEEVVGNKHNDTKIDGVSGVQLHANGEVEAEVEDKEVIADGKNVYSHRLKFDKKNSYADKIKQIVKQRNKLEKKQETASSKREKNTIERQLAGLNMAENAVFEHQEATKYNEGIQVANNTFAMGGKIGDPPGKKTKRPSYEKAIYNGVTGLAKDIIQAEVISKLLNKGDQLINKVSKANKKSAILDTGYDAYNTIKSYAKGDMVGMGSNFVGALLPGVSGKTIEAVADNYIPKENQEGQDANAFIANYGTGSLGKQLLDTYGAGYKSSKAFKKDLKDGKLKDEQSIKNHLKNYKPTTTPIAIEKYAMGGRLPKLLLGGGVPPKKKYGAFGEPIPNGKFKGLRRNAAGQMKLIPEDDKLQEAVISAEGIPLYDYDKTPIKPDTRSRAEIELEKDAVASNANPTANALNAAVSGPGTSTAKPAIGPIPKPADFPVTPNNATTPAAPLATTPAPVASTAASAAGKFNIDGALGTAAKLAPMLLDNIGNAIMSKNTPKLTTPLLNRAAPLESRVNINPQLAEIRRSAKSAKDTVLNNTSNSNNAKTNAVMADLNMAKQQNELIGNKENQELTLRNADSQNKQNMSMANNATMNQHAMNQYQRTNDIRTQVSGNLANLQGDIKTVMQMNQAKDNFDGYTMANLADDDNGTKLMSYMSNEGFMKDPKNRAFMLSRLEEKDADGKYKFEGQRLQAKRLNYLK